MLSSIGSLAPEDTRKSTDKPGPPTSHFMTLKIVRGPLEAATNRVILRHYNRLASVDIPLADYLHWVQDGPDGPAWHVLLENEASEIVGHSSVIPLRCSVGGKQILAGKSEYSFILEEYRSAKIRGFENLAKLKNAIMVHQLFLRCQAEGLGPLLISTSSTRQRSLGLVGCSAVTFPVSECLLVLRPWSAVKNTPNLNGWQRASLGTAGAFQIVARLCASILWGAPTGIRSVPIGQEFCHGNEEHLRFFNDPVALKWRYPEGQYEQLAFEGKKGQHVIVKSGASDRYLRVCQWHLGPEQPTPQLVGKLVELAKKQQALGVRWAIYGDGEAEGNFTHKMRKLGFVCARRTRTILVFSKEQEFLSAGKWDLADSLFSFDL